MKRVMRGECGASAVEFALVLPALLLILFSIIEYGWYMTHQIVLVNAVTAGARAGIAAREWDKEDPEDPVGTAEAAVRAAFWLADIPAENITVNADYYLEGISPRMIKVEVTSLEYHPLTGYLPDLAMPQILGAKAVMVFP
jgi:Flp pilus assembly protein TadG